jgi:hypothetical protein
MTVPNIQQNPQDTAAFYLAHIYQQLSTQPNGTQASIPLTLTNPTEPFHPPRSGVWVNGLWFLSLVISLTCALLATLVQQWARRYLRVAYPRCSPHKKARIRAFYRQGVEKLHIPWTMEAVPMLLHIFLFLFFGGLSVFLFGVHLTIFKVVTAWIAICVILYACLTSLPIIHKDSPYSTPLSGPVSFCFTGIRHLFFRLLQKFPDIESSICMLLLSRDPGAVHLNDFYSHSMIKTAEEFAMRLNPNIDHHSLLWTFESLDQDTDLEKFFEGFRRLCDSETGGILNLQQDFIRPHRQILSDALIGLMNRTLSSTLVSEFVKLHRMIICTKVVDSTSLLGPWWILRRVLLGDWYRFLESIDFALFVQDWKNITHPITSFYSQCVGALTVSIVRDRDEHWFKLASGLLNVSKYLLHIYDANGDSMLLANTMFIVRRTVQTYSGSAERHKKDILDASSRTLDTVCKLDIGSTLPELQHEFCGLWNRLVDAAQTDQRSHHVLVSTMTLKNIRKLYIALHATGSSHTPPTTFFSATDDRDAVLDNPMTYPMCTIDGHHPSPVPDLQFDEPPPDPTDLSRAPTPIFMPLPTPTFPYTPARQSTFNSPFHGSLPQAPIHFPVPQLTYIHSSNVPPTGNVERSASPPPKSTSSVSSIHLDNVSTGGHL